MSQNPSPGGRHEKMTPVTKQAPCPVCEGDHKCSVGDGGLIVCGRRDGLTPGFRHLGACRGDPQFHLYRRAADEPPPAGTRKAPKPTTPRDWGGLRTATPSGSTPTRGPNSRRGSTCRPGYSPCSLW